MATCKRVKWMNDMTHGMEGPKGASLSTPKRPRVRAWPRGLTLAAGLLFLAIDLATPAMAQGQAERALQEGQLAHNIWAAHFHIRTVVAMLLAFCMVSSDYDNDGDRCDAGQNDKNYGGEERQQQRRCPRLNR